MDSETVISIVTPANGADSSDYIVDDAIPHQADALPLQADAKPCFDEFIEGDYGGNASEADDILESASFSLPSVVSQSTSNFLLR
jgi:hypothetical protein